MNTKHLFKAKIILQLCLITFFISSCATIASFDQYAYQKTTSLKVDMLNLVDKAETSFKQNEKSIKELEIELQKIYEYSKNKPKDSITTKMWRTLMDPNGTLYGSFIALWKKKDTLSNVFINQAKEVIEIEIDKIAILESKKIKK